MYSSSIQGFIIFIVGVTLLLLMFISFIVTIVYKYQQKQNVYYKDIEELKITYESAMMRSQLEMQEQTFQHISREIHDSIGQKLSLAKLHLNTLVLHEDEFTTQKIEDSVSLIGESIIDLSDISRSMSSEIILNNGLIKALEYECTHFERSGLFKVSLNIYGNMEFLEGEKELVLFRILQEALNNIIKHAIAKSITINLHYDKAHLCLEIIDNGKGFIVEENGKQGLGLTNMQKRATALNGSCTIKSWLGKGTTIKIEIPLYE